MTALRLTFVLAVLVAIELGPAEGRRKDRKPLNPDRVISVYDDAPTQSKMSSVAVRSPFGAATGRSANDIPIICDNQIKTSHNFYTSKVIAHPAGKCPKSSRKYFEDLKKLANCQLRDTIVFAESVKKIISPSAFVVKRCGGECANANCIAQNSTDREFTIRQVVNSKMECATVRITEHVSCGCGCLQLRSDCIPGKQRYNDSQCKCECIDMTKYNKCVSKNARMWKWSEKSCECICIGNKKCTTGSIWSNETCKCKKVTVGK